MKISSYKKHDPPLSGPGADFSTGHSPGAKQVVRQPKGEHEPESELPCSCPRRDFVDPLEVLPMPATESIMEALEEFIKEHYKSSAFNKYKRQQWPITSGAPLKIHTPADAVCTYCRKAKKVPLYFRNGVRAGLEADVKKGVLKRVPMGEPDTWCSCMVIQPKKLGRARRTVDMSGQYPFRTRPTSGTRLAFSWRTSPIQRVDGGRQISTRYRRFVRLVHPALRKEV